MTTQRIALITGANKGIGYEVAQQLAAQGFIVLLGARDAERGAVAAKNLQEQGFDAHFVPIDLVSVASISQAAAQVDRQWGRVDVLVNNAGVNYEFATQVRPSSLNLESLKATFETNVFGAFAAIQQFLPLLKRSADASVINVSSTLGSLTSLSDRTNPFYGVNTLAYNSSKTALNALTVSLAKDLAADRIQVNSICPGWVQTDMGTDAAPRTVDRGASIILKLATMPQPPTGGFFDETGEIPW
jgi:NAD(P)-dependent dehydrogenase (short-subunit alcohol dehydrogenase family)